MSLIKSVASKVISMRRATADDIAPLFPEHTRDQIMQAMSNARYQGYIVTLERGKSRGKGNGTYPHVYGPPAPKEAPRSRCISSVFDLGSLAEGCRQVSVAGLDGSQSMAFEGDG